MINLLPDESKKEIRAARANVLLLRYNFLFLACAAFILLSSLVIFVFLRSVAETAKTRKEENSNLATEYTAIKNSADKYRKNLETARKILDNEVIYTEKVFAITNLLPSGVVLDSLSLNAKEFGKPTILSAHAKNYDKVKELKEAFESEEAKDIFSDVHFQGITRGSADSGDKGYSISVTISVTINKVGVK